MAIGKGSYELELKFYDVSESIVSVHVRFCVKRENFILTFKEFVEKSQEKRIEFVEKSQVSDRHNRTTSTQVHQVTSNTRICYEHPN